VTRLIDGFIEDGECEFMDAFARPFPSLAFFNLAIHAPAEDIDRVAYLASRSSTPNVPADDPGRGGCPRCAQASLSGRAELKTSGLAGSAASPFPAISFLPGSDRQRMRRTRTRRPAHVRAIAIRLEYPRPLPCRAERQRIPGTAMSSASVYTVEPTLSCGQIVTGSGGHCRKKGYYCA
jgi:hypothetical protein